MMDLGTLKGTIKIDGAKDIKSILSNLSRSLDNLTQQIERLNEIALDGLQSSLEEIQDSVEEVGNNIDELDGKDAEVEVDVDTEEVEDAKEEVEAIDEVEPEVEVECDFGRLDEVDEELNRIDGEQLDVDISAENPFPPILDDFNNLKNAIDTGDLGGMVSSLGAIAGKVSTIAAGFKLAQEVFNQVKDLAAYGDDIDKTAQKLGMTFQGYQEWSFIAEHTGTNTNTLARAIRNLQSSADEVKTNLGIDISGLTGEDGLTAVVSALQAIPDPIERTSKAMEVLGPRVAQELMPLINSGPDSLKEMTENFDDLNGAMSDIDVKNAAEAQDAMTDLNTAIQGLKNAAFSFMLPALTAMISGLADFISKVSEATAAMNDFLWGHPTMTHSDAVKMIDEEAKAAELVASKGYDALERYNEIDVKGTPKLIEAIEKGNVLLVDATAKTYTWEEALENSGERLYAMTKDGEQQLAYLDGVNEKGERLITITDIGAVKLGIVSDEAGEIATVFDDVNEAAEDTVEIFEDLSEVSTNTFRSARDEISNMAKEMQQAMSDKFSINLDVESEWGGNGFDATLETQVEALTAQAEKQERYRQNVNTAWQAVSEGYLDPQIVQDVLEQGEEGANQLEHIAKSYELGQYDLLQQWNDLQIENKATNEELANSITSTGIALQMMNNELGSSKQEWQDFEGSIRGMLSGDELKQANQIIDQAKSMGVKIPEGLLEGMKSSQDPFKYLQVSMDSAMKGQVEGLMQSAKELGIKIPQEISQGMQDGSMTLQQAQQQILTEMIQQGATPSEIGQAIGRELTEGEIQAINEAQGEVQQAVQDTTTQQDEASTESEVGSSIKAELSNLDFSAETAQIGTNICNGIRQSVVAMAPSLLLAQGQQIMTSLKTGMEGKKMEVLQVLNSLKSQMVSAVQALVPQFQSIGSNIASAMAAGISSGASTVIAAAVSVATAALAAAKGALGIASPSKEFLAIGKNIDQGLANGILNGVGGVIDAVDTLAFNTENAYHPELLYATGATGRASSYSSPVGTTYTIYVDNARVNDDEQIRTRFEDLMIEMARKGMM